MTERKPCIHCNRQIDANARICPFCNWDQSVSPTHAADGGPEVAPVVIAPPGERRWRTRIIGAFAFVLLMVLAFFVGSKFHSSGAKEVVSSTDTTDTTATSLAIPMEETTATTAKAPPRPAAAANVVLVPVPEGSADNASSTPQAQDTASMADGRTDASALAGVNASPAQNGAAPAVGTSVDPRSLGGVAYQNGVSQPQSPRNVARPQRTAAQTAAAQRAATQPPLAGGPPRQATPSGEPPRAAAAVSRTEPRPIDQPIPDIDLRQAATARLRLTVGPDGRVHDIDVRQTLPRDMNKLIASVQNWRFRPATENGVPVVGHFTVDITFNGNR